MKVNHDDQWGYNNRLKEHVRCLLDKYYNSVDSWVVKAIDNNIDISGVDTSFTHVNSIQDLCNKMLDEDQRKCDWDITHGIKRVITEDDEKAMMQLLQDVVDSKIKEFPDINSLPVKLNDNIITGIKENF